MKKLVVMLCLCVCLCLPCAAATPGAAGDGDVQNMLNTWQKAAEDTPLSFEELQALTLPEIAAYLWQALCSAAKQPLRTFLRLAALLLLAAVAQGGFQPQVSRGSVQLYEMAVVAAIVTLLYKELLGSFAAIGTVLEESRTLLSGFLPVFSSVMVACGQGSAATACNGIFLSVCMLLANTLGGFCLPVLRVMMALHIAGSIGSGIDMGAIAEYGSKLVRWLLTVACILFCAIWGVQNVLAGSVDGAALQAGKALLGSTIPIIGKAVSEAFVGVLAGMKALKGGIAFALLVGLGAAFLPVLLQCASVQFFLFGGSIVAEGCGLQCCKKLLRGFADCARLACFILLFFFLLVTVCVLLMLLTGSGVG